jgi:hypothetical protein
MMMMMMMMMMNHHHHHHHHSLSSWPISVTRIKTVPSILILDVTCPFIYTGRTAW